MQHYSNLIYKDNKKSPYNAAKTTAGNLNGRKTKKRTEPRDKQLSLFS